MGIPRAHSLDALRAAMMLLGLVLHSAASYTHTPIGWAWPYQDRHTSVVFDVLIISIHLFRMPAFFLVAGFFAALLYGRDGAAGFARNRARRVLLPLLLFWASVVPTMALGFIWSVQRRGAHLPWDMSPPDPFYRQPILGHLWFLYFLLLYYTAALLVTRLASRLPAAVHDSAGRAVRALATTRWGPFAMAAITMVTLLPMHAPGLDTAASLVPPLRVLVAHGVFFVFGWLLHGQRDELGSIAARWKLPFLSGVAATVGYITVLAAQRDFTSLRAWHVAAVLFASLSAWLLIVGVMGLFARHLSAPRPGVRYLADASYWMYLTHTIPATWLPGVLATLAAPAAVKFALVLGLTTLVTIATYHYLVRPTVVGELLNGRRYRRRIDAPAQVH